MPACGLCVFANPGDCVPGCVFPLTAPAAAGCVNRRAMGVGHLLPCVSGLSMLTNCSLQPRPPRLLLVACTTHMPCDRAHGPLHDEVSSASTEGSYIWEQAQHAICTIQCATQKIDWAPHGLVGPKPRLYSLASILVLPSLYGQDTADLTCRQSVFLGNKL